MYSVEKRVTVMAKIVTVNLLKDKVNEWLEKKNHFGIFSSVMSNTREQCLVFCIFIIALKR